METREKQKIKKLKSLDELKVGDRIVIKAENCPHSDDIVVVFDVEKLHFLKSYKIYGDLRVGVYKTWGKAEIDQDGRLITSSYVIDQISSEFNNLEELSQEMKKVLLDAGYELPGGIN